MLKTPELTKFEGRFSALAAFVVENAPGTFADDFGGYIGIRSLFMDKARAFHRVRGEKSAADEKNIGQPINKASQVRIYIFCVVFY